MDTGAWQATVHGVTKELDTTSVQVVIIVQSLSLTLCDLMDCTTPGFPVLHHLPEFLQTHVHQVGDAIQPSHPLSFSSLALTLSQNQDHFSESALCLR